MAAPPESARDSGGLELSALLTLACFVCFISSVVLAAKTRKTPGAKAAPRGKPSRAAKERTTETHTILEDDVEDEEKAQRAPNRGRKTGKTAPKQKKPRVKRDHTALALEEQDERMEEDGVLPPDELDATYTL